MTNEEEIAKLKTELAVQQEKINKLEESNKELKQNHQELRDKHHKLADNTSTHVGLSNLLHIFIPFLGVVGFVFNHLGKKNNENKIKEIVGKKKPETQN